MMFFISMEAHARSRRLSRGTLSCCTRTRSMQDESGLGVLGYICVSVVPGFEKDDDGDGDDDDDDDARERMMKRSKYDSDDDR